MTSVYIVTLLALALVTLVSVVATWSHRAISFTGSDSSRLSANYLLVFALVLGADWLQGPYVWSLYHDEYGIDVHTIALLFVLGFLTAGLTSPFIGSFADKYGRRKTCLSFTVLYSLSCITKLFSPLPSLVLGRILGGISTSILFSCFEAWLVAASKERSMDQSVLENLLGTCQFVNGLVASLSGVFSNVLVQQTGTFTSPFIASAVLLVIAGIAIKATWTENYGLDADSNAGESHPLRTAIGILRNNPPLWSLCISTTIFESSMYLFVFLWVPTMQDAAVDTSATLPLGTIFSSFMVAMMLGSTFFSSYLSRPSSPANYSALADAMQTSSNHHYGKVCSGVLLAAALALIGSTIQSDVRGRFFCFCLYEGVVGVYYPVLGSLRSAMIPEECRATMMALFRLPLNLIVTLALVTGLESQRDLVFHGSSVCLVIAAIACYVTLVRPARV